MYDTFQVSQFHEAYASRLGTCGLVRFWLRQKLIRGLALQLGKLALKPSPPRVSLSATVFIVDVLLRVLHAVAFLVRWMPRLEYCPVPAVPYFT